MVRMINYDCQIIIGPNNDREEVNMRVPTNKSNSFFCYDLSEVTKTYQQWKQQK